MKSYTITVNGNVYDVTVEENGAAASAPTAAPKAAPAAAPKAAPAAAPAPKAASAGAGAVKVTASVPGKVFKVDAAAGQAVKTGDTIITLEVLLSDSVLFSCMDSTVRDLAALRGTYRIIPETDGAVRALFDILREVKIRKANILLDEPVSNSGRLKALIADIGESYPFELDIRILKDVDRALYEKEYVITSDSIILDHCRSWANPVSSCLARRGRQRLRVWSDDLNDK